MPSVGPGRALVLAHYHSSGLLRTDTCQLVRAAQEYFRRIVLVSTRLELSEIGKLPEGVRVFVRDNIGYDFYSYRLGIACLADDAADFAGLSELALVNTSFLCVDGRRFFQRLFEHEQHYPDCFGVVKSHEVQEHIQSYVVVLRRHVFMDPAVQHWWSSMIPISERSHVILNYEIGLSRLLATLGYRLDAAFDHVGRRSEEFVRRFGEPGAQPMEQIAPALNPSHFFWRDLLQQFGILKIEVFKSNPFRLDLAPLESLADADPRIGELVLEGQKN